MKLIQRSLFSLAFSLTLFSQIGLVQAQSFSNLKPLQISQKFKPRVDNKPNPVTDGGATRGRSCLKKPESLKPLTPANIVGTTVSERPTFFLYVPDSTAKTLEFNIFAVGETENLYEGKLPMPKESGIISFTLPENAPPLKINQTYQWSISMICNNEDFSANPRVSSWVERIEADSSLLKNLERSNSRNLAAIYGEAGIWNEGLNAIAKQRCIEPNNLLVRMKWRQFLESAGLNEMISKKLINSCSVNNR
jgi:hypothetical protein